MVNKRGALIALEGKTTTFTQLAAILNKMGEKSVMIQFPDLNSPIGSLLHHEIEVHAHHLLSSANRWERATEIVKTLSAGTNVILYNYAYSGVAKVRN